MIVGMVNANREATIRLLVIGPQGYQQEIEAIIDTGFTGFLTLPPLLVTTLGFPGCAGNQAYWLMAVSSTLTSTSPP
jgi:predicted aspartyl protease